MRAAAVERIPQAERALNHLAAARMLDAEGEDAERIAPHLLNCDRRADSWVVETLRRAGGRSVDRGAPEAAVRYLRRALEEPPPPTAKADVLAELGRAEVQAALPEDAIEHLRAALAGTDDPRKRAAMAHDLTIGLVAPGHYVEAVEMLERAVEDAMSFDRALALGLQAELITAALLVHETNPLRLVWAGRSDADLPGRTRGERMLLSPLAWEYAIAGEERIRAVEIARRTLDQGLLADVTADSGLWINVLYALIVADEFEAAEQALEAGFADINARGSVIGFARNSFFRSVFHYRRGAIAEAEADARRCIEVGMEPGYRVARMAHSALVDALIEQGELDAADQVLRAAGLDTLIPDTFMTNFVLHSRAWLRLAQGRLRDAATDFEDLWEREHDWRARSPAAFPFRSGLALALLGLGERERAIAIAREELELSRGWGTARAIGISLRTLGLAEGGQAGIARLRESASVLEPSGARLAHGRSLVELGAAVRRTGRRSEAREPLRQGMELAHRCGATALAARARDELVATGARPRRAVLSGVEALTASERRVAGMAAEGLTNREIAQALFVTMRTVEVHLTHVYQKLAIASRAELPAALA